MCQLPKRLLSIILCTVLLLLGGCWNRREVETLAFVTAAGIDQAARPGKIQVTVQIAKPAALAASSMGGSVLERASWLVTSTGDTVFEAVRNFSGQSSRRLFWAHKRWLILGEELAKEGVEDVLDFFARDGETRRTAKLAIVKDGKASDFLQTESEMERLSSQAYAGILENSSIGLSTVVDVDLHHFLLALASEGIEPVAVRVEVIDRLPDVDIRGQMEQRFVSSAPRITGAAVFRGPKLVGWLDKQETRGYNWVMGKVESGIIVIEKPGHEGKYVGLELIRAKSEIKPEMTDGKLEITVKVVAEANIGDIQEMLDVTDTKAMVASAERRMATVIANEIGLVLHKTQLELASDILGFGRAIYRKYPKEWRNLRETWNDQGFKDLKVKVEVQTRIRHIGLDEIGLPAGR